MTTLRTIFTDSMQRLGIIQANEVPTAGDMQVCLNATNPLIDSLSNDILNIHTISPQRFPLTPNQQSYKLGPAVDDSGNPTYADFVTTRPMRIENAVVMIYPVIGVDTNGNTVITETSSTLFEPLQRLNWSQFSDLTVRNIQSSWPTTIYNNNAYPCITLKIWPVPQDTLAIELWMWEPLATYASLDDELNLPPGYARYLTLKVCQEIASSFAVEMTPALTATLTEAENSIRSKNQQVAISKPTVTGRQLTNRMPSDVSGDRLSNKTPRIW